MEKDVDELKERQENEVEALKSIFDHNFKDCRQGDVWQVRRPPEFEILILPENSTQGYSQAYVSVTLKFKFTSSYPRVKPDHSIANNEGLSKGQVDELQSKLESRSDQLEGNEMVYELCVEASQYLAKFNVRKFTSFAEEREVWHQREAAKKEEGQKTLEDIRRKALAAKVAQRKQEMVEEQKKVAEEEERCLNLSEDVSGTVGHNQRLHHRRLISGNEENVDPEELVLSVDGEKVKVIRGRLLGINSLEQKTFVGFSSSSGSLLALSRWIIKNKKQKTKKVKFEDHADVEKSLMALEQEMNSLQKLKHSNLVKYHGLSYSNQNEGLEVYIVQEFVTGVDMSGYLSGSRMMDLEMIRSVCQDVLQGLHHLHSSNIVHRDIRDTSIFMNNYGTFRLADFSVDRKLREIIEEKNEVNTEDLFPQSVGRGGKKSDIYRIGLLVLSFKYGYIIKDQFPTIPGDIPDTMQDFIKHCLCRDEKSRWSADQLLDHSFIKEPIIDIRLSLRSNQSMEKTDRSRSVSPDEDRSKANSLPFSIPTQGQSRLQQDFEILSWLGRGGFGDVIKVKNKLDEKKYAIKRIRLNPADKATNRKIMREVKLLSRLNHENVVRYYNSWQEVTTLEPETGVTETSDNTCTTGHVTSPTSGPSCSFVTNSFRPPATPSDLSSVEWSVSVMPHSTDSDSDDSDSSDDDDDDMYGHVVKHIDKKESSGFIVFDSESKSKISSDEVDISESDETSKDKSSSLSSVEPRSRQFHYMYIQMEFCDKLTMRNCIDNDLFKDSIKIWRMFREIVEGLVHIHTQGMIHRDLKPVNIFIDSKDHVKIGDFGLATAGLINPTKDVIDDTITTVEGDVKVEEDMTGQIGTAMYVAPELGISRVTTYNQKVDLYSLGIIFFEMCYKPLATGMERIKVLTSLRTSDIVVPDDWDQGPQETYIVKWLLSHDPLARPTSQELLQSDFLPPVVVEESIMNTMVRNAMKNTSSKAYKHLIDAVMKQPMSLDKDLSYDTEIQKMNIRLAAVTQHVIDSSKKVLELHGAVLMDSPCLLPRGEDWHFSSTDHVVTAMTRSGDVVSLPYDLRTQFARFLVRTKINQLKRYSFGKVLRERKIFGVHPRELTECAVDIVTPPGSGNTILADAEIIVLCQNVVTDVVKNWTNSKLYFRISHHDLVSGILQHFGIIGDSKEKVLKSMRSWDSLPNRANGQVSARLQAMGFTEQVASSLAPLLEAEVGLSQLGSILRNVTKRKGEAGETVKAALAELKNIETSARHLGLILDTVYCIRSSPSHCYQSGLIVQMFRIKHGRSGSRTVDIIAAGGRYDNLIKNFGKTFRMAELEVDAETDNMYPRASGISISVDRLVNMVNKMEDFRSDNCDVVIGGDAPEACAVAKEFWNNNVKALIADTDRSDEAVEIAKDNGAEYVVMVAPDGVSVMAQLEKEGRVIEKKFTNGEVIGYLTNTIKKVAAGDNSENVISRQESSVSYNPTSSGPIINYNFDFLDREKYSMSKKKLEVRKSEKLATALEKFDSQVHVEVICVGYPDLVVRTMAVTLDLDNDVDQLFSSLEILIKEFPRYRKDMRCVVEEIASLRFTNKRPVIVLFSLDDNTFKIIC